MASNRRGYFIARSNSSGSRTYIFPIVGPTTDRNRALVYSYGPDWLLSILFITTAWWLDDLGYRREFSLEDKTIQYTFKSEQVPPPLLFTIAFSPLLFMGILNYLTVQSKWDAHNSSLGLSLGISLTCTVTQVIKITVGRPRPDLIFRCIPGPIAHDPVPYGLSNSSICTQPDIHILRDGFRSFPSGHASISFTGLGFLSWYIAGKLKLWDGRGHSGKAWLALIPLVGAALIAISRTMDNRHHWQDVIFGSAMGILVSYFTYRQYFPPPYDGDSHLTYDPRIDIATPPITPEDEEHGLGRYGDLEARLD